jgi:hypothetical protein
MESWCFVLRVPEAAETGMLEGSQQDSLAAGCHGPMAQA